MIEQYFPYLVGRKGVSAVVLCDKRGQVRSSWVIPKLNRDVLGEICEQMVQAFSLAQELQFDVEELVVPFEKGLLYARITDWFLLAVVARLNLDVSLLRLMVNVHLADFMKNKKILRMLKKWPDWPSLSTAAISLDDIEVQFIQQLTEEHGGR